MRAWLGRKAYYGSGSAGLATRHGQYVAPAVLSPSYAVAAAAVLTRHRFAAPIAAAAVVGGQRRVRRALPRESATGLTATRIAVRGLGWAVRQESALVLRHWWPAAAVSVVVSSRARRVLASAVLVDLAVVLRESDGLPPRDLPAYFTARRLDDLAYGTGLWWGAVRVGSVRSLVPRLISQGRPRLKAQSPGTPPASRRESA